MTYVRVVQSTDTIDIGGCIAQLSDKCGSRDCTGRTSKSENKSGKCCDHYENALVKRSIKLTKKINRKKRRIDPGGKKERMNVLMEHIGIVFSSFIEKDPPEPSPY